MFDVIIYEWKTIGITKNLIRSRPGENKPVN